MIHSVFFPVSNVNEPEREISLCVPCSEVLDYIHYTIARQVLGQTEILYDYQLHRQTNGNFNILLPRPSFPLRTCLILVLGYRNGERVFEWEKSADKVFK